MVKCDSNNKSINNKNNNKRSPTISRLFILVIFCDSAKMEII